MAMYTQIRDILKPLLRLYKSNITDVKLDNILVNYTEGDIRVSNVQQDDLSGVYSANFKHSEQGTPVAASMWTSLEVIMETLWNTVTDVWSFETMVSLNYNRRRVLTFLTEVIAY